MFVVRILDERRYVFEKDESTSLIHGDHTCTIGRYMNLQDRSERTAYNVKT